MAQTKGSPQSNRVDCFTGASHTSRGHSTALGTHNVGPTPTGAGILGSGDSRERQERQERGGGGINGAGSTDQPLCGDEKKGKRQDERQEQGTTRNTTRHGPREGPSTFGASFVRARYTIGACTVVAVSQPFASRCKTKTCLCHPVSSCFHPVAFSFVHFFNNSLTTFFSTLFQLLFQLLLQLLLQLLSTNLSPFSVSKPLRNPR